ncbi:hypothetical protein LPJ72_001356 [Coemansia sp. Benny D160-2]|nr:hypothetical protein LPJ72_001356 [Coemansia sp. Benny D160-2]
MTDCTRLQTLVKPLLRGVLLKVHPDFFAHNPTAKRANQASVQRLQDLLAPVLRRPADPHIPEPSSKSKDLTSAPLKFTWRTESGSLQSVSFAFTTTAAASIVDAKQLCAQRSLDLVRLCDALGVKTAPEAVQEITDAAAKAALDTRNGDRRVTAQKIAELRAARAREARANYARAGNKTKTDEIHAALMGRLRCSDDLAAAAQEDAKRAVLRLNREMVFFADSVNPGMYQDMVCRIEDQLHELDYHMWHRLPLMVVDRWQDAFRGKTTKYPGFVIIPCDFDIEGKIQPRRIQDDNFRPHTHFTSHCALQSLPTNQLCVMVFK